jgi:tetratricopeptide (TPR) repeat protein
LETALPLWSQAAAANPYWAMLPATVGVLTHAAAPLATARALAPGSDLLALNAGVLAEAQADTAAAQDAYRASLDLRPASATALFWQQTPLRAAVLADWQAAQPTDTSALAQGEAALVRGDSGAALDWFQQAQRANPESNLPYVGLARAHWAAGDRAAAQAALAAGQRIPVTSLAETLPLRLLAGEFAAAEGNRAAAQPEFEAVFSAINDYTFQGPGTFGYPQRSWYVYHRPALPSDLVPQFARADITTAMDTDFAQLAEWYWQDGDTAVACLILGRVQREAPASLSGARWMTRCAPQS